MPHFNLRHFLETLGKRDEETFVLQIGAMDGKTFDPVHEYISKFKWPALMVEPIEERFEELQKTYAEHDNIVFENVAIAQEEGSKEMFYIPIEHVKAGEVPKWGAGVSSFYEDRNALAFDNVKPFVKKRQVDCITLEALLVKHDVEKIDVLQIDAEGYDYHILKQLDFSRFKPKVINLELVNMPKSEQHECKKILDKQGYLYIKAGYDLLAVSGLQF